MEFKAYQVFMCEEYTAGTSYSLLNTYVDQEAAFNRAKEYARECAEMAAETDEPAGMFQEHLPNKNTWTWYVDINNGFMEVAQVREINIVGAPC